MKKIFAALFVVLLVACSSNPMGYEPHDQKRPFKRVRWETTSTDSAKVDTTCIDTCGTVIKK